MSVICVTGPMAAGKNAVSAILERRGFACVDADVLAHKAVEMCKDQIVCAFEKEAAAASCRLLNDDGTLNRRSLGALIFPRPDLLARQEAIVHPAIEKLAADFMKANPGKNIVLNATVLYKVTDLMKLCDLILFVDAPKLLRFVRARRRDGMKAKEIFARFKAQKKLFECYAHTGIRIEVVKNFGSIKNLENKIESIVNRF